MGWLSAESQIAGIWRLAEAAAETTLTKLSWLTITK